MNSLDGKECEPCRVGAPLASQEDLDAFLPELPGWEIVEVDGVERLKRIYEFSNFADALAFTNRVGEVAEAEGHHPALLTEWGSVTVAWWTHKIEGLHINDFIMASKTDRLA